MSSKILGNVWDACAAHDIKGAKLVIMARTADYSNDEGVCYPSVETICRQLGLGKARSGPLLQNLSLPVGCVVNSAVKVIATRLIFII